MPYNQVWVGVFCTKCDRPILNVTDTEWSRLTGAIMQSELGLASKFPLRCPDPNCSVQRDYRLEQFVRFRVEQI